MFGDLFRQQGYQCGICRFAAGARPQVIFLIQFKNDTGIFRCNMKGNAVTPGVWLHFVNPAGYRN